MSKRIKHFDMANGKKPNDHSNHMLDHFGFYFPYDDLVSARNDRKYHSSGYNSDVTINGKRGRS